VSTETDVYGVFSDRGIFSFLQKRICHNVPLGGLLFVFGEWLRGVEYQALPSSVEFEAIFPCIIEIAINDRRTVLFGSMPF
jgi:hypothetical protein